MNSTPLTLLEKKLIYKYFTMYIINKQGRIPVTLKSAFKLILARQNHEMERIKEKLLRLKQRISRAHSKDQIMRKLRQILGFDDLNENCPVFPTELVDYIDIDDSLITSQQFEQMARNLDLGYPNVDANSNGFIPYSANDATDDVYVWPLPDILEPLLSQEERRDSDPIIVDPEIADALYREHVVEEFPHIARALRNRNFNLIQEDTVSVANSIDTIFVEQPSQSLNTQLASGRIVRVPVLSIESENIDHLINEYVSVTGTVGFVVTNDNRRIIRVYLNVDCWTASNTSLLVTGDNFDPINAGDRVTIYGILTQDENLVYSGHITIVRVPGRHNSEQLDFNQLDNLYNIPEVNMANLDSVILPAISTNIVEPPQQEEPNQEELYPSALFSENFENVYFPSIKPGETKKIYILHCPICKNDIPMSSNKPIVNDGVVHSGVDGCGNLVCCGLCYPNMRDIRDCPLCKKPLRGSIQKVKNFIDNNPVNRLGQIKKWTSKKKIVHLVPQQHLWSIYNNVQLNKNAKLPTITCCDCKKIFPNLPNVVSEVYNGLFCVRPPCVTFTCGECAKKYPSNNNIQRFTKPCPNCNHLMLEQTNQINSSEYINTNAPLVDWEPILKDNRFPFTGPYSLTAPKKVQSSVVPPKRKSTKKEKTSAPKEKKETKKRQPKKK